jgi:hypothetical protein
VVQQLIEKRADLNMDRKDEQGWTALPLVVENGHEVVAGQLAATRKDDFYANWPLGLGAFLGGAADCLFPSSFLLNDVSTPALDRHT